MCVARVVEFAVAGYVFVFVRLSGFELRVSIGCVRD